jgi:hypothetical protein
LVVGGGERKVFISTSGAVGEGCDLTIIPTLWTVAMLYGDGLYRKTVVVQPRPPKTPVKQTDRHSELIYKIEMSYNLRPYNGFGRFLFYKPNAQH